MRRIGTLLLLLSLGLLLAACGGATESGGAEPAAPEVVQEPTAVEEAVVEEAPAAEEVVIEEAPAVEEVVVEEPAAEEMAAEEPAAEEVMAEVEEVEEVVEEPAAIPTLRVGMQASNPTDFQLASGSIQLVEFFAFW